MAYYDKKTEVSTSDKVKQIRNNHSIERCSQRYKTFDINDLKEISKLIRKNGKAIESNSEDLQVYQSLVKLLKKESNTKSIYLVMHKNKLCKCVYSSTQHGIITVLPTRKKDFKYFCAP